MKSLHASFDPIACHGCKKPTNISTKFGVGIACANGCGVVHVPVAVEVASGDDVPKGRTELTEADVAKLSPAQIVALLKGGAK